MVPVGNRIKRFLPKLRRVPGRARCLECRAVLGLPAGIFFQPSDICFTPDLGGILLWGDGVHALRKASTLSDAERVAERSVPIDPAFKPLLTALEGNLVVICLAFGNYGQG